MKVIDNYDMSLRTKKIDRIIEKFKNINNDDIIINFDTNISDISVIQLKIIGEKNLISGYNDNLIKNNFIPVKVFIMKNHVCRCQGSMPAEIYFHCRSKPAQVETVFALI